MESTVKLVDRLAKEVELCRGTCYIIATPLILRRRVQLEVTSCQLVDLKHV